MESDALSRIFSAYTAIVFFFFVPRFLLIKAFAARRFAYIAMVTMGLYLVNVGVSTVYFPHATISAFGTAMMGPFMSLVLAMLFCEWERGKSRSE